MNEIKTFDSTEFGAIRAIEVDSEPWFVLADVCKALELSTPARVAERLDDDEVSQTHITDTIGRKQEMTIINESGLYSVILRSDKPQAKPFRKWVTSEVLPTIRKTGSYALETKSDDKLLVIELTKVQNERAKILMQLADTETLSQDWKNIIVSKTVEILTGEKLLPLPESEKTYSATEIGEMFGVSAQKIGKIANANGMKTSEYGKFYKDKSPYCSKEVDTFRYNEKAIDKFKKLLS